VKLKTVADRTGENEVLFLIQPADTYFTLEAYQKFMYALSQIEGVVLEPYESRFEKYHDLPAIQK
jgi:hypothetical protein